MAPGAFVVATQYHTDPDLIASSMVASTFISAPLMFISAKMITLTQLKPEDYLHELERISFDLSILALVAAVWVLLLFTSARRIMRMPHRITACLLLSQFISCSGIIMWSVKSNDDVPGWSLYVQFVLVTIGTYASRLWSAILAITLLFLQCRSLCFALKLFPTFMLIAWGLPTCVVAALLLFDHSSIVPNEKRNPNFQYGNAQAAIAIFFLVMCFIIIVGCLVMHERYKRKVERYLTLSRDLSAESDPNIDITAATSTSNLVATRSTSNINFSINDNGHSDTEDDEQPNVHSYCAGPHAPAASTSCALTTDGCCTSSSVTTSPTVVDIEDLALRKSDHKQRNRTNSVMCSPQYNCPSSERQNCKTLVQKYEDQINTGLEPLEYSNDDDPMQIMRHIVLLILLLCSMLVGLSLSIWTLVMEGMSGIYIELTFLDCFLNSGQSIIVLACFITDSGDLFMPVKKYWRKLYYGTDGIKLQQCSGMR